MFQLRAFVTVLLWTCLTTNAWAIEFKKGQVQIGKTVLSVEFAETEEQQAHGLMYRSKLDKNSGMLFIFKEERILSFWMKNTFIPLSIAYVDKNLSIVDIQDMSPVKSVMDENPPSYPSKLPASYALEVNQGFFKQKNIKVGDKIKVLKRK